MGRTGSRPRRGARAWRIVVTPAFARDAEEQVRWLLEQDREDWARGLKRALRTARTLLQSTPRLAKPEANGLRRLLLGRLPLFLWYGLDEGARTVIWLRLFHVRQSQARGPVD